MEWVISDLGTIMAGYALLFIETNRQNYYDDKSNRKTPSLAHVTPKYISYLFIYLSINVSLIYLLLLYLLFTFMSGSLTLNISLIFILSLNLCLIYLFPLNISYIPYLSLIFYALFISYS